MRIGILGSDCIVQGPECISVRFEIRCRGHSSFVMPSCRIVYLISQNPVGYIAALLPEQPAQITENRLHLLSGAVGGNIPAVIGSCPFHSGLSGNQIRISGCPVQHHLHSHINISFVAFRYHLLIVGHRIKIISFAIVIIRNCPVSAHHRHRNI